MSLSRFDIEDALRNSGFTSARLELGGSNYSLPKREYLNTEFKSRWEKQLFDESLATYAPDRNDCVVHSINALSLALREHVRGTNKNTSLALGLCTYIQDEGSETHMLLWAVVEEPTGLLVINWEPQLRNGFVVGEVELSGSERNNCSLLLSA